MKKGKSFNISTLEREFCYAQKRKKEGNDEECVFSDQQVAPMAPKKTADF